VTKKIGDAVLRNRVRRRLKEALRLAPDLLACRGYDYVILARQAVLNRDFIALQEDLVRAIAEVHTRPKAARPPRTAKSRRPSLAASAITKD
jgi:ribonuclease P protein component